MTHRDRSASEASEQTEKLNLVKFGQGQWVPRSMGAKVNGCQGLKVEAPEFFYFLSSTVDLGSLLLL